MVSHCQSVTVWQILDGGMRVALELFFHPSVLQRDTNLSALKWVKYLLKIPFKSTGQNRAQRSWIQLYPHLPSVRLPSGNGGLSFLVCNFPSATCSMNANLCLKHYCMKAELYYHTFPWFLDLFMLFLLAVCFLIGCKWRYNTLQLSNCWNKICFKVGGKWGTKSVMAQEWFIQNYNFWQEKHPDIV